MYKERVASCSARISTALRERGMRPAELCRLSGVPKSSLSLYMSGAYEPKQDNIYRMAIALNVSEAWLRGYDVPMERKKLELVMKIGDRIRKLRKERGIKQIALAKHLGMSASTIGMYEQNRREPDDKTKIEICRFFGVSMDYLVGMDIGCTFDREVLSINEKSLLSNFRKLSPEKQEALIQLLTSESQTEPKL